MTGRVDAVFADWRYRWSKLCIVDDQWHVHVPTPGLDTVRVRRWRWWNPADLARFILHRSWARSYW